jgi:tetratricopeptide (TPR) repeat protein
VAAADDDRLSIDAFAVALALQDDLASAKGYWQHLAQLSPVRESTLLSLAKVCEMQNEPERSLAYIDRLVDANPGNEHFRLFRSRLYLALRRSQEAIAEARRAVEINPSEREYYRHLAIALRAAGLEGDAAQAEQTAARLAGKSQRE